MHSEKFKKPLWFADSYAGRRWIGLWLRLNCIVAEVDQFGAGDCGFPAPNGGSGDLRSPDETQKTFKIPFSLPTPTHEKKCHAPTEFGCCEKVEYSSGQTAVPRRHRKVARIAMNYRLLRTAGFAKREVAEGCARVRQGLHESWRGVQSNVLRESAQRCAKVHKRAPKTRKRVHNVHKMS